MIFVSTLAFSQGKINIPLQYYIKTHPKAEMRLLVKLSSGNEVKKTIRSEFHFKPVSNGWFEVKLKTDKVKELAKMPNVKMIYFNAGSLKPLSNDTMRIKSHVLGVYNGNAPLNRSYKGKNVLLGFIDTGVEIKHPDLMNADSSTRIVEIWDQGVSYDGVNGYGYGHIWDSASINNGTCTHQDLASEYGHGTQVVGIAASDGNAPGNYIGIAPKSDIAVVATNFNAPDWGATFIDAVQFLYHLADSLNEPCVINASVGGYAGSHDATDPVSLAIDSMLNAKNGRAFVAAAGNAGNIPYHLHTTLNNDTSLTWFEYNSSTVLGTGGMFFSLWADTNNFKQVQFAIAIDKHSPNFEQRAFVPFSNIQSHLNQNIYDTLVNSMGDTLGIIQTYAEKQRGKYLLQVAMTNMDSTQYYLRFETKGTGSFDVWSGAFMGFSDMVNTNIPNPASYPLFSNYQLPDTTQTICSSFQCSSDVITVGDYNNLNTYLDYDSTMITMGVIDNDLSPSSSRGPTRSGLTKPDIASPGNVVFNCSKLTTMASLRVNEPAKMSPDGMHQRNGGTSLASPIVAGAAALLLEKCPNMSYQQVKEAILNSTFQDDFTGTTPNNGWGYGKLNIFDAMVSTNYTAQLTPNGNQSICDGTNLYLTTSTPYSAYNWSTGSTSQGILINQTGNYSVEVTNSEGCLANSDTLHLTIHPNPPKPPIWYAGNKFHTSAFNGQLQWYKNILPVGTNDTILNFMGDGSYFVARIDSEGCTAASDTIQISLGIANLGKNNAFKIYPQPANQFVIIDNNTNENGVFDLKDISGREITSVKMRAGDETRLNLQQFAAGMYIYLFDGGKNKKYTGKIIIYH